MGKVAPLQGNVVDLSPLDLGPGGADVVVMSKWMRLNPAGLTRLTLDLKNACGEVVAALHELVTSIVGEREAARTRKRLHDQFRPPFRRARPPAPHHIFGVLDFFYFFSRHCAYQSKILL